MREHGRKSKRTLGWGNLFPPVSTRKKGGSIYSSINKPNEHAFKRAPAERINLSIEEIGNLFILGPDSHIWKVKPWLWEGMNERLRSSVTGQVLAEFFINHLLDLGKQLPDQNDGEVIRLTTTPWQMYFDGSSTQGGAGAGIVFISLNGLVSHHSYRLFFLCTNNVADYEALLIGLELAAACDPSTLTLIRVILS